MDFNEFKASFDVRSGICFEYADKDADGERTVFSSSYADDELSVTVYFTFSGVPLVLRAECAAGDKAVFVYRPYRIELYINGVIADEEWPAGSLLFGEKSFLKAGYAPVFLNAEAEKEYPDVIRSFTGAEGWNPGGGVFVGDCMPYSDGKRYHVIYLKDRHHHQSKWSRGAHQWEHISSGDLIHWDVHPMAVPITDPSEGSICTGSWLYSNGRHYLYYTVRTVDGTPAPIRRSVSDDGFHYTKDKDFGFVLSDKYTGASARDPKAVIADDGSYHMFVTTTRRDISRGCLAHLTSSDGENWKESGEIYISPDGREPECPDYFFYKGKYYLVTSLGGRAHYLVSDRPFDGWTKFDDDIIQCEYVPKAAVFRDRLIFTGFRSGGGYAGTMTFTEAVADEKGHLTYMTPVRQV